MKKLQKPTGPILDLSEYQKIPPEYLAIFGQVRPTADIPRRSPVAEPYVQLTERAALKIAKATNSPGIMVWYQIIYLSWQKPGRPVTLANKKLMSWGVAREIKRRVLHDLEDAGLILVERRPKKSPKITVLLKLWKQRGKE
jgi:hypothetical protein